MSGTAFHYCGKRSVAAPGTDARRCAAVGWVGGGYPSAPLQARTAAFDGHCAFTRAARSAGLRFAVILLSKTMDVGRDHLIHRKRSPFPYEGKDLTRLKVGLTSNVGRSVLPRTPSISEFFVYALFLLFANLLEGFIKGNCFAVYCLLVSSFHHCVELRVRHSVAGGHISGVCCHDDHLRLCGE